MKRRKVDCFWREGELLPCGCPHSGEPRDHSTLSQASGSLPTPHPQAAMSNQVTTQQKRSFPQPQPAHQIVKNSYSWATQWGMRPDEQIRVRWHSEGSKQGFPALCKAGGNVENNLCGKQFRGSSKKLNTEMPYDPAIPLLDLHPKELKAGTKMFLHQFIAGLFTITQRCKQLKSPLKDEQINKWVYYVHSGILFSHKKEWNFDICYNMDVPQRH